METKVKSCTCQHEFQDSVYGKGRRVHNKTNGNGRPEYRCTVCGVKPKTRMPGQGAKGGGWYPAK